jgi:hypothetical protein
MHLRTRTFLPVINRLCAVAASLASGHQATGDDGVSGVSAGKAQRAVGYIRSAVQIWEQMVDLDVEVTEDL